ncbi:hypothetical protein [Lacinutrix jangbogonensis]|uniref:hypothetical protein n=1 Tax=Lacinutrix jangbogonensis TaxID=1469557 RepID=UPI00053D8A5B|nr:hypothetical protein [Lacinutrix jangbogonensis]
MKRIILLLCIIVFTFSCSSDDNEAQTTQPPESNFYALTVGNSWVYKNFQYNPNTMGYDETTIIDAVIITGTETISGETYYKFKTTTTGNTTAIPYFNANGEQFMFLRELFGDLVNETGDVVYTNNNYEERLVAENSWGNIYDKLKTNIQEVTVGAGTFNCLDMERYAKSPDNTQTFPALDHFYYSEGIGLVSDSSSFVSQSNPAGIRRLESYNVQ